ncbi:hypothetical protein [Longispora urticae]
MTVTVIVPPGGTVPGETVTVAARGCAGCGEEQGGGAEAEGGGDPGGGD